MPDNRKGFASALHIRGLRQRWMFSAVLPILLLLVLAVALFSVGVQEYYYNAMRSGLESRARIAAETFTGYGVKSYSEYYRLASYSAETFEEKDTIELQFINTNGRVQVSSYGLTAGTLPGTSDVDNAIGGKMASFQGRDPQTGENILAVSYPLFFNSRVVGVLRYVTSLREAQHRVLVESLLASAAALVCMALIAASNAIFINNVVQPVAVVSDAARRISGGSYGIMIENHYRDELGELVDQHQRHVTQDQPGREDPAGIHLVGLARAANAADRHQRLGGDALCRPRREHRPDEARPRHHFERVPPPDDDGRGAARVHKDAGRALHAARGERRSCQRARGRDLHLFRALPAGGHRGQLQGP